MNSLKILSIAALLACLFSMSCSPSEQVTNEYKDPMHETLSEVVGDASVVALGEPSHFLEGIHAFNTEMFKYLVEEKGFRLFCFESFWQLEFELNEFIQSDRDSLSSFEGFQLNAFNSKQAKEMLLFIRSFNRANPDDPITVIGYQPEQPVSDLNAIIDFFEDSDFYWPANTEEVFANSVFVTEDMSNDLDAVIYASNRRRGGEPGYLPEDYEPLIDASKNVYDFIVENEKSIKDTLGEREYILLKQRAISLHAYANIWMKGIEEGMKDDAPDASERFSRMLYQSGDSVRAEVFKLTMQRYPDKKAMIWMHNWHAAKRAELSGGDPNNGHPPFNTLSFGSQMFRSIGDDYVVIGSIVACKKCDYDQSRGFENAFYEKVGTDTILVDLKNPDKKYADLPLNEQGEYWVQAGSSFFAGMNLSEQFDAIYYIPESDLTTGKSKH